VRGIDTEPSDGYPALLRRWDDAAAGRTKCGWRRARLFARPTRFYEKLNELLSGASFDNFVGALCLPYFLGGDTGGRPSIAPGKVLFVLPLASEFDDADLSAAERDVAALILRGRDNASIANLRGTSVRTVANQVASIFNKLGVRSRAELAALVK
jgi:DNA-binding CsgD family transcriptional regulator